MEIRRVFVDKILMKKGFVLLTGERHRYIVHVLRKQEGDRIDLVDGKGYLYSCLIQAIKSKEVYLKVLDAVPRPKEKRLKITLCVSPIKGTRMDWLIEKATELGIERIVPTIFRRTVVRIEEERSKEKTERWKRIAVEASRQSGRFTVPEILLPVPLRGLPAYLSGKERWAIYERESERKLKDAIESLKEDAISLVVGPEGGIEEQEAEWLRSQGFMTVSLGDYILRTETVPLFLLSILNYEFSRG